MQVSVEIEEDELEGDHTSVAGLRVKCTRCGHEVEVFGTDERSAKRAVMLREECPRGERNFYIVDWD